MAGVYCRLCIKLDTWMMPLSLFNKKGLVEKIYNLFAIKVTKTDPLQYICHSCLAKLEWFDEFNKKVKKADNLLRALTGALVVSQASDYKEGIEARAVSPRLGLPATEEWSLYRRIKVNKEDSPSISIQTDVKNQVSKRPVNCLATTEQKEEQKEESGRNISRSRSVTSNKKPVQKIKVKREATGDRTGASENRSTEQEQENRSGHGDNTNTPVSTTSISNNEKQNDKGKANKKVEENNVRKKKYNQQPLENLETDEKPADKRKALRVNPKKVYSEEQLRILEGNFYRKNVTQTSKPPELGPKKASTKSHFNCIRCDFIGSSGLMLREHCLDQHGLELRCKVCNQIFNSETGHINHINRMKHGNDTNRPAEKLDNKKDDDDDDDDDIVKPTPTKRKRIFIQSSDSESSEESTASVNQKNHCCMCNSEFDSPLELFSHKCVLKSSANVNDINNKSNTVDKIVIEGAEDPSKANQL